MFYSIIKWIGLVCAIIALGIFVAVYFIATDPNDAPLLAAWVMGCIGLLLGRFVGGKR